MSLPKFDPWSVSKSVPSGAYRAYCAYPVGEIGTSGTIGTAVQSKLEIGPDSAFLDGWQHKLVSALATRHNAIERKYLESALVLCRSQWLPHLLALGWGEADLFACDPADPRNGGLVQAFDRGKLIAVTGDAAYLATQNGREQHDRRPPMPWERSMIWDARSGQEGDSGN